MERLIVHALIVHTMMNDEYEWDEAKRLSNIAKHQIDFAAMYEFEWSTAHRKSSDRYNESRFAVTGYIGDRLHVVIYTMRGERKRIISLRRASKREEIDYAQA